MENKIFWHVHHLVFNAAHKYDLQCELWIRKNVIKQLYSISYTEKKQSSMGDCV